ncbi:hypothetical protein R4I43_32595 [Saccharopolyspora sp. S2-29]|uniref:Uncharacterized protein n=1 Tax=Saccharopolyspora mangrovi TaxID=3082379 RepID=A0ABU6ALF7_9PSEU|nr:hypothetical protein [Saccharopolyspora sp. S2-29]MEB3372150.1 hypothetical protein [Saccharopolyspora sp. S2-29]
MNVRLTREITASGEKIMSAVLPCWTTSPLTRVRRSSPSERCPASSAVTIGPIGPLPSAFLPSVHCEVSFWARRAVRSLNVE